MLFEIVVPITDCSCSGRKLRDPDAIVIERSSFHWIPCFFSNFHSHLRSLDDPARFTENFEEMKIEAADDDVFAFTKIP